MSKPSTDHPSRSAFRERNLLRSLSAIRISGGPREGGPGRPEARRGRRPSRRSSLNDTRCERQEACGRRDPTRRATDPADGALAPHAGGAHHRPRRAAALAGDAAAPGGDDAAAAEARAPNAAPPPRATAAPRTEDDGNVVAAPEPVPASPRADPSAGSQGFRRDYQLGDVLRSPADAVLEPTEAQAFCAVSSLKDHDLAFVKRSDGSFSYAILAYRSTELIRRGSGRAMVECMNFVTSADGATKKVAQGNWSKYVRLPAQERQDDCLSPLTHEPPIRKVAFLPQMEDEHSMISNVSESASLRRWRRMQTT